MFIFQNSARFTQQVMLFGGCMLDQTDRNDSESWIYFKSKVCVPLKWSYASLVKKLLLRFVHLQRQAKATFWFFLAIKHGNLWDSRVMKPNDFIDLCCELAARLNVVFLAPGNCTVASWLLLVFAETRSRSRWSTFLEKSFFVLSWIRLLSDSCRDFYITPPLSGSVLLHFRVPSTPHRSVQGTPSVWFYETWSNYKSTST